MKVCLLTFCSVLINLLLIVKLPWSPWTPLICQSTTKWESDITFAPISQRKKYIWIYPFGQILLLWCCCAVARNFRSWIQNLLWIFSTPILKWCSAQRPNTVTKSCLTLIGVYLLTAVGNTVRIESKRVMSRNGLTDWERKTEKSQTEKDGLRENVSEAERDKKAVYIYSSMHSTHVDVSKP